MTTAIVFKCENSKRLHPDFQSQKGILSKKQGNYKNVVSQGTKITLDLIEAFQ